MKKTLVAAASFLVALTLSACNTIEGVGKDVKAGGESLENAARTTREKY
ncbi:MAG: entericidin A/B family lipoprotein [Burkholderiales bacterium]